MRRFQLVDKRTGEIVFDGVEASASNPCWVCDDIHSVHSWCLVDSARGVAICPRVESERKIGDAGWWHGDVRDRGGVVVRRADVVETVDFADQWSRCKERVTTLDYVQLAEHLGMRPIDFPVFVELGAYWGSWAFPMMDAQSRICGIKLRSRDGSKSCVKGSRLGLIFSRTFDRSAQNVIVTEGESDSIVAASWGFNAVARPGAKACTSHLEALCRGKDVVLVADRDAAGLGGAAQLRDAIGKRCRSCSIVTAPTGVKDLRAWHNAGATAEDLHWAIDSVRGFSAREL